MKILLFRHLSLALCLFCALGGGFPSPSAQAAESFTPDWVTTGHIAGATTLHDALFLTTQHGIAVGDSGTVYVTDDGGASWRYVTTGTGQSLTRLVFGDGAHGYAIGADVVLATSDGGASWHDATPPPGNSSFSFSDVTAPTGSLVYVADESGAVYRSADSGATWQSLTSSPTGVASLSFSSSTAGWAATSGGELYHTVNGGLSWSDTQISDIVRVRFVSDRYGLIVESRGQLLQTDSGAAWTIVTPEGGVQQTNFSPLLANSFGYATADDAIYKTTNAGLNWQPQTVPLHTAPLVYAGFRGTVPIALTADGTIMTEAAALIPTATPYPTSTPTWTPSVTPGPTTPVAYPTMHTGPTMQATSVPSPTPTSSLLTSSWGIQALVGSEPRVNSIAWQDASRGWIVGERDTLYSTTDGGTTWTYHANSGHGWSVVHFVDASRGFIVGGTELRVTDDGGNSWTDLPTPFQGAGYLVDAAYPASDRLYAAVENGYGNQTALMVSTDHGGSWTPLLGAPNSVSQLDFVTPQTGYLLSMNYFREGNDVYRTTDGGIHWSLMGLGGMSGIRQIFTPDSGTLYLSTSGGIERSRDGGNSWTRASSPTNDSLTSISFGSALRGMATTRTSVYLTTDGGQTWTTQALPYTSGDPVASGFRGDQPSIVTLDGEVLYQGPTLRLMPPTATPTDSPTATDTSVPTTTATRTATPTPTDTPTLTTTPVPTATATPIVHKAVIRRRTTPTPVCDLRHVMPRPTMSIQPIAIVHALRLRATPRHGTRPALPLPIYYAGHAIPVLVHTRPGARVLVAVSLLTLPGHMVTIHQAHGAVHVRVLAVVKATMTADRHGLIRVVLVVPQLDANSPAQIHTDVIDGTHRIHQITTVMLSLVGCK